MKRLVVICLVALPSLYAGPFNLQTQSFADFNTYTNGSTNGTPLQTICLVFGSACTGSAAVYGTTGLTESYTAYGSANYGLLTGYVSASISGSLTSGSLASDEYSIVREMAWYDDTLTFTGGTTGAAGTVSMQFHVNGSQTLSPGNAFNNGNPVFVSINDSQGNNLSSCTPDSSGMAVCSGIPVVFGQSTFLDVRFLNLITISNFTAGSSATADFSHTVVLTGIGVDNSLNQPITNFSISSASGADYTAQGVVPEPTTITMIGGAMGVFALLRGLRGLRRHR